MVLFIFLGLEDDLKFSFLGLEEEFKRVFICISRIGRRHEGCQRKRTRESLEGGSQDKGRIKVKN